MLDRILHMPMLHHGQYKDEVHKQNHATLSAYLLCGLVIALIVLASRMLMGLTDLMFITDILVVYYLLLFLLLEPLRKVPDRFATAEMYILVVPALVLTMLASTVFYPSNQGITFLLYLVIGPLFIMDRPGRQIGFICTFAALFAVVSFFVKPYSIFFFDAIHAVQFGVASICLMLLITSVRYHNIESYLNSKNLSEHHDLTGLKNRRWFMANIGSYDGQAITVAMVDLDDFKFFNDTYGHKMGDSVIAAFGAALRDAFGEDACFNYGGDEFLIVTPGASDAAFEEKVSACRAALEHLEIDGREFHPHFSCGYVYGITPNRATTLEMTTYADANLYRAKNAGRNRSVGSAYVSSDELAQALADDPARMAGGRDADPITGLPLQPRFVDQGQKFLDNISDADKTPAVVYFNVEDLKGLNQEYGFDTGDKLLTYLAGKLAERFRGQLVCSAGAGEFFALTYDDDDLEARLEGAHEDAQDFPIVGKIYLKAGVYTCEPGVGLALGCDRAKLACASLRRDRSTFYKRFDQHLEEGQKKRLYVIRNFAQAMENGWTRPVYQPIVSGDGKRIYGFEALGRWVDPVRGNIEPAEFIPILEEYNLIAQFNLYMVEQICKDMAARRAAGRVLVPVSVNTSISDYGLKDMVTEVVALLDQYGLEHSLLVVEITESCFMNNPDAVRTQIRQMHEVGIRAWLDHFGEGYASMRVLNEIDFDLVKVDIGLIDELNVDSRGAKILLGVKSITETLGIRTLVESVETREQHDFLAALDVDLLQGNYYSAPLSSDVMLAL